MTSGGSIFDDFPENQFTKFRAVYPGKSGPRRITRYYCVQSKIVQFSLQWI